MENWITEALDGNFIYFSNLQSQGTLDQCVDEYGMTPLMYAVLGKGYCDSSCLASFARLGNKNAKNCLGQTAREIFLSIGLSVSKSVISPLSSNYHLLSSFAKVQTGGRVLGGIALGVLGLAMDYFGTSTTDSQNAIMSGINEATNSEADIVYAIKRCQDKFYWISDLSADLGKKKAEYAEHQRILENTEDLKKDIYSQICEEFIKTRKNEYKTERQNLRASFYQTVEKDEFETEQEYSRRKRELFKKEYGPDVSDAELSTIPESEMPQILERTEVEFESRISLEKFDMDLCEQEIQKIELQIPLLDIYALPFAKSRITFGTYDADKAQFPISFARYSPFIKIPRQYAKTIRNDPSAYTVELAYSHEGLDYRANLIVKIGDKEFESEEIACSLLYAGE